MGISYDTIDVRRRQEEGIDQFWRAELRGSILTILSGDAGTMGETVTKTFASPYEASNAYDDELARRIAMGFFSSSEEELKVLQKPESAVKGGLPRATDPLVDVSRTTPVRKPVRAAAADAPPKTPNRKGRYAEMLTGKTIHRVAFGEPASGAAQDDSPRATSGGRPIMAVGQPWPICDLCNEPLSLYLQFDVEEHFELAFRTGSHVLLFHCPRCPGVPTMPRGAVISEAWLDPGYRSFYRVIINPPGVDEEAHEPDPVVREQIVAFAPAKEVLGKNLDGPIGEVGLKLGGIPHWEQPYELPRCTCGAPMGFVLQVTAAVSPGWITKEGQGLMFGAGMSTYVFACAAQSSPYAAVMFAQR